MQREVNSAKGAKGKEILKEDTLGDKNRFSVLAQMDSIIENDGVWEPWISVSEDRGITVKEVGNSSGSQQAVVAPSPPPPLPIEKPAKKVMPPKPTSQVVEAVRHSLRQRIKSKKSQKQGPRCWINCYTSS